MKKIYALLIAVAVTAVGWSQTTRQWVGPVNSSWTIATNWASVPGGTPGVPLAGDVVLFNDGASKTVTNVPTIELSGLFVENTTTVVLANATANNRITISNGAAALDFKIDAGSVLDLAPSVGANGVNIRLKQDEAVRGSIAGRLIINVGREYSTNLNAVSTDVSGVIECRALVLGNTSRLNFLDGSSYIHDLDEGDIPDATWATASNCIIRGSVFNGPRFLNRAFGNFTWDCAGQVREAKLAASGMTVSGTFTVANTGTSFLEMDQTNFIVTNLAISGGTFVIGSDYLLLGIIPIGVSRTIEVRENFSVSGGNLMMGQFAFIPGVGTINVKGHFSHTGGVITESGAGEGRFIFNGPSVQTFTKSPAATISNNIDFTVNANSAIDFGTSILNGSLGTFTLNSSAKIITSNVNGLSANGSVQISRSYSAGADYEFRGPVTGVFNTSGGAEGQVRDLIINNTSATPEVTVNAGKIFLVNRNLVLNNGYVTTTAANQITVNTAGTATSNNGAFVNGFMAKRTNSTALFEFPVGKVDGGLRKIGVKPIANGVTTYVAQFFRGVPPAGAVGTGLHHIGVCEYWQLYRSSGSVNAAVVLTWSPASPCGPGGYVSSPLDIRVAQLLTGTWQNRGNAGVPSATPASGSVISNTVTSIATPTFFTLASASAANPLPVVFGDVRAYEKNDGVQIDWSNLTEKDVALYTIERSSNGRDFGAIGTQLPTSNRDDKASYSGFDASPIQGVNYYRIKAEETTGKIVYSKVLTVNLGSKNAGLRLYPNPVTGHQITLSMSDLKRGTYNLQVVNVSGQEIFKKAINNPTGNLTQTLDLPTTIKAGMYHLVVTGENYREMKTFIIQ